MMNEQQGALAYFTPPCKLFACRSGILCNPMVIASGRNRNRLHAHLFCVAYRFQESPPSLNDAILTQLARGRQRTIIGIIMHDSIKCPLSTVPTIPWHGAASRRSSTTMSAAIRKNIGQPLRRKLQGEPRYYASSGNFPPLFRPAQ